MLHTYRCDSNDKTTAESRRLFWLLLNQVIMLEALQGNVRLNTGIKFYEDGSAYALLQKCLKKTN